MVCAGIWTDWERVWKTIAETYDILILQCNLRKRDDSAIGMRGEGMIVDVVVKGLKFVGCDEVGALHDRVVCVECMSCQEEHHRFDGP